MPSCAVRRSGSPEELSLRTSTDPYVKVSHDILLVICIACDSLMQKGHLTVLIGIGGSSQVTANDER